MAHVCASNQPKASDLERVRGWALGHEHHVFRLSLVTSLVLVISYPVARELPVNVLVVPYRRPREVLPTRLRSCLLGFLISVQFGISHSDSHSDEP